MKQVEQTVIKTLDKEIPRVAQELYNEAVNMYDSMITKYYADYSPVSYVRHKDRQNSWSMGLYDGQNITLHGTRTRPIISIDFLATGMANDYQHHSAIEVLENVMSGQRGVPPFWVNSWDASYSGKYFSYPGGTMKDAYELFVDQSKDIIVDMVSPKIQEALTTLT